MEILVMLGIILLIASGIGLVAYLIYLYYQQAKKRREEMAVIASKMGFEYQPKDFLERQTVYSDISIFNVGHSREAKNAVTGSKNNCKIDIFDYSYKVTTSNGKTTTTVTYPYSVCIFTVPQRFRYLFIRTENLFDKIAGAIGFDDIDFESAEFSKCFYVKSDDKKFAYDIVHQGMMDFMVNYKKVYGNPPLVEIKNNRVAFYRKGFIKPEKYIELYNFAGDFYKKTPNYVLEER